MSWTVPKIVYDPGTGPTTLTFIYQPRNLPYVNLVPVRHDNYSTAGARETLTERVDEFLTINMQHVKLVADAPAWEAFFRYALRGGTFAYYPDSAVATFTNYTLDDSEKAIEYKAAGFYTFSAKFRKVVT